MTNDTKCHGCGNTVAKTCGLHCYKASATITRRKILRSRLATGPGPAWKYIYDVTIDNGRVTIVNGADMLATARRMAKEQGFAPVESWKGAK